MGELKMKVSFKKEMEKLNYKDVVCPRCGTAFEMDIDFLPTVVLCPVCLRLTGQLYHLMVEFDEGKSKDTE